MGEQLTQYRPAEIPPARRLLSSGGSRRARRPPNTLTDDSAQDYEPLGTVAVVSIERSGVDGPAEGTGEQSVLHVELVDEDGRENATETHQGKDDAVAGIDLGRRVG